MMFETFIILTEFLDAPLTLRVFRPGGITAEDTEGKQRR
jgi:hypothetical protein